MLVRDAIVERLEPTLEAEGRAMLPDRLKPDTTGVRTALLQRLAASRLVARGVRAGALRAAARRSGLPFRLDTRQRVIVKALISRHGLQPGPRAGMLAAHVRYLGRSDAGIDGTRAGFFDARADGIDGHKVTRGWAEDRHHFRLILSPEHGDRIADLPAYVREVMRRVADDLGEPALAWVAVCHHDTAQPHAHVLVRGRRGDGRDLVIPRDYVGYGIRARAQETAQAWLGDLSRAEAERRIWRETEADRFTGFDRRLLAAQGADGQVADGVGGRGAWAALTRGRLRRLEQLGLAERVGGGYRLAPDLEARLRGLQLRRDIIRTLNQRRLEGAREVRVFDAGRIRGEVMARGAHDELGRGAYVMVRTDDGVEHYARLGLGQTAPAIGKPVELVSGGAGLAFVAQGRGRDGSSRQR